MAKGYGIFIQVEEHPFPPTAPRHSGVSTEGAAIEPRISEVYTGENAPFSY